jgi:cytidylate kinase
LSVPVIAIDGPSGSGKGTVSRRVAAALGYHLLDSGALYRLVGLAGRKAGLDPGDEAGHAALAARMAVRFATGPGGEEQVTLGGEDVTAAIRTELAGNLASKVASFPAVRTALVERQRRFAQPPGLVADGRDMGTVIFPDAALKVFLTASAEERALRRYRQLRERGLAVDLAALTAEIAERDQRDLTRAASPLAAAADAIVIDSTAISADAVVAEVTALARARLAGGMLPAR